MSLKVCIMAPDRVFWNATADEIILPTNTGQMGILTNHTPLITGLDIGVMLVRGAQNVSELTKSNPNAGVEGASGNSEGNLRWISMALMGGFALIQENTVTILVNDAELSTSINLDAAEKSFQEAQKTYEQALAGGSQKEKIAGNLAFKRARARLQLVKK